VPGTWLARIARHVFHDGTFDLMVSPAIADLQLEAKGGMSTTARGYVAVSRALAGAVFYDLFNDLRSLREDASDLLQVVAMQVSYYAAMTTLIGGGGFGRLSSEAILILILVILCLSLIPALLCFWPARCTATRSVRD
jgi:hypothetical protein